MGNRSWQPWRQNIINAATKATWTGSGGGGGCKGGHSQNSMLCMTHSHTHKRNLQGAQLSSPFSLSLSLTLSSESIKVKSGMANILAASTKRQTARGESRRRRGEEEGRELVYSICHSIWQFDSIRFSCLIEFKTKRNEI